MTPTDSTTAVARIPSTTSTDVTLPPVAPHVVAAAVADLPSRLRGRLDAMVPRLTAAERTTTPDGVRVDYGPDIIVVLTPGPDGVITDGDQVRCTCLLAPRCLHRAALLAACPVAEHTKEPETEPTTSAPSDASPATTSASDRSDSHTADRGGATSGPTAKQRAAADSLWRAGAAVLAAGVPAAGPILQAELLRAAHTARVAGLPRAEAAALRVVRGLRNAQARHPGHRLADLVRALLELLLVTGRLAAGDPEPGLVGVVRRSYRPGGSLAVYGVCREPVISATGYAGVVTHLLDDDGRWYSVADVRPAGPERAAGSGNAVVEMGRAAMTHHQLSRGGLRITGATVSPEGRLGAGRGVRVEPISDLTWREGPAARLFTRPLREVVPAALAATSDGDSVLVGADLVVVGASGDRVLARETTPGGPLIWLMAANSHPALAHLANLRAIAARPGLHIRVVGRVDPERAGTLRPLAVASVPDAAATLRLPDKWLGHADLGYDRLQGAHFSLSAGNTALTPVNAAGPDPLTDSPLWMVRRLVELAVAGGRRAVGESAGAPGTRGAKGTNGAAVVAPLRRAGFHTAADLLTRLVAESTRRGRDAFGRVVDPDPDRYTWAWVATATHLVTAERAVIQASWAP